jgi:hypothetical protein
MVVDFYISLRPNNENRIEKHKKVVWEESLFKNILILVNNIFFFFKSILEV